VTDTVKEYFWLIYKIYNKHPGQIVNIKNEIENIEKILHELIFYISINNKKKVAIYITMIYNFRNIRHWYYYKNSHLFTIGEYDMPMETSQCPQYSSPVGGRNHQAIGGVRPATDLERQFGGIRI
jgi:hypothetical protein